MDRSQKSLRWVEQLFLFLSQIGKKLQLIVLLKFNAIANVVCWVSTIKMLPILVEI